LYIKLQRLKTEKKTTGGFRIVGAAPDGIAALAAIQVAP
jgi:hypothetical protein